MSEELSNTEKLLKSADLKGTTRRDTLLSRPQGPGDLDYELPKWNIEQVVRSLQNGRSVIAVVRDHTTRIKIADYLAKILLARVGEPRSTPSSGVQSFPLVWTNGREFNLSLQAPEELYQTRPLDTDVIEFDVPADWLK